MASVLENRVILKSLNEEMTFLSEEMGDLEDLSERLAAPFY